MSISLWDLLVIGELPTKGVVEEHKDKTYLATFLSYWLCVFVFPDKQLFLHPEVFQVASLMGEGYTFSLTVPVLVNIYSGLRQIHDSTSSLGHSNACFPLHYVHRWLAIYFNTHYKASTSLRSPCMVEFSGEGGVKYYTNLEAPMHIHKEKSAKFETEEQPEEGTKCLVTTLTPPARFKLPARSGTNNVSKDIHILTTDKRPSKHTEDSQSNNDDRHWKRSKRLGDHVLNIEGTLKPMASPEVLSTSENSKTPISATVVSTRPLVFKESPQRVEGNKPIAESVISHFCANNLIFISDGRLP
ncbi:uncharacterized protein E5676_scaffold236G00040 [Cucumis melo var. makuwa]|uniref:Aminotransferase-like plant mobile domain-containing protein n=1 Tax=Cucumis melo var. makuwa TaxID=1194695 RepID=A0A5A7U4M3_CUCMM|nr:uncharacterized protein E6C27_scaffold61G002130 [Cucumis melo var. makuwa]TYK27161.1 uncharacterized protein E5676_scaffold236G00040 [Cucumis melo var. makuwa]